MRFDRLCRLCRRFMVEVVAAGATSYDCPEHGLVPEELAKKPPAYTIETKTRGVAVVVSCLAMIDEQPFWLQRGRPVFLEFEWEGFKGMSKLEAGKYWDQRVRAINGEIELRATNPARTIHG